MGWLGIILLLVAAVLLLFSPRYTRRKQLSLDLDRAFDEEIAVDPVDHEQLQRLQPLVHEIRILRLPQQGGRHTPIGDVYDLYVIDSLGAIHEVMTTHDRRFVCSVGLQVAAGLDLELIDEEKLLV